MNKPRIIKVIRKKLFREKALGQSHMGHIEVDPRLRGKKLLEILLHEMVHELWPEAEEDEVEYKSATMARTLWHEKWRNIDDDDSVPMQDEIGSLRRPKKPRNQ